MTPLGIIIWHREILDNLFETVNAVQNNLEQQVDLILDSLNKLQTKEKEFFQDMLEIQHQTRSMTKQIIDSSFQTLDSILLEQAIQTSEKTSLDKKIQDPAISTDQTPIQSTRTSGKDLESRKTTSDSRYGKTKKSGTSRTKKNSKKAN